MKKEIHLSKIIQLVFLGILIFLFILLIHHSYQDILNQIKQTPLKVILWAGIIYFIYQSLRNYLFIYTSKYYSKRLSWHSSMFCTFVCCFYNFITLGAGSIVYILYFYNKHGIPEYETTAIQFFEFLIFRICTLLLGNIMFFNQHDLFIENTYLVILFVLSDILNIILVIGCIILCTSKRLHHLFVQFLSRVIKKETWQNQINKVSNDLTNLREQFLRLFSKKFLLIQTVATISTLLIYYHIPYILLQYTGINYVDSLSAISVSNLIAGIVILPARIGSVELSYYLVFTPLVDNINTLSSLLVYRFITFLLPILLGAIFLFSQKIYKILKKDV